MDLARGVDGEFFTADELSEAVFGRPGCVEGYRVPEAESMRYKQSHGCRIQLDLRPEVNGPDSAFYKRIVLRELPYAVWKQRHVPFKLGRDVQANRVEASVLSSAALRAFDAANAPAIQGCNSIDWGRLWGHFLGRFPGRFSGQFLKLLTDMPSTKISLYICF